MSFSETFNDDLAVTVGGATKASEYNDLSNNSDALKERLIIGHFMANTGVTNEDGFHKGRYDDPAWYYAKGKAGTPKYFCIYLDDQDDPRIHIGNTTLAPTATEGNVIALGEGGGAEFV